MIVLRFLTLGVSLAIAACVTGGQSVQLPTARPGQVMLTGFYNVPEGKGPFPAVELLHGGCNLKSETHVIDYQNDLAKVGIGSVAVDSWLSRGFFGPACSSGGVIGPGQAGMQGPQTGPIQGQPTGPIQTSPSRPVPQAGATGPITGSMAGPGRTADRIMGPPPTDGTGRPDAGSTRRLPNVPAMTPEQQAAFSERILDAYGAIEWLRSQPWVDPGRIALIGFSDGGRVGLYVTTGVGPTGAPYPDAPMPRAVVGYYPSCFGLAGAGAGPAQLSTMKVPYLAHVAGNDDWPGTRVCPEVFARLAREGAPFMRFDYPGVSHDFNARQFSTEKRTAYGTLLYNAEADRLAWDRTLAFLREKLATADK